MEESAFEGEVEDASSFEVIEGADFCAEFAPLRGCEFEELIKSPVMKLGELQQNEGVMLSGGVSRCGV